VGSGQLFCRRKSCSRETQTQNFKITNLNF